MAYPAIPKPKNGGYQIEGRWKTVIGGYDGTNEQRRQKQAFVQYDVTLSYNPLAATDFDTLWNFYMAQRGAFMPFYFFALEARTLSTAEQQYMGMGDGAQTIFDIPGASTSSHAIYLDGAEQAPASYTVLIGGGADGSDRVQFNAAPGAGAVVSAIFTGFLRMRCRFNEDRMGKEHFAKALYSASGIKLKGLPPEG